MSIGTPIDRIEERLKLTGAADYASDRILEGMLYGVPGRQHDRCGTCAAGVDGSDGASCARRRRPCSTTPTSARCIRTVRHHSRKGSSTNTAPRSPATTSQYYGQYVAFVVAQTLGVSTRRRGTCAGNVRARSGAQRAGHVR